MAHEFESGMFVREKAWHGLGVVVESAPTSEDALRLAGLDWDVLSKPVCTEQGLLIPNYKANMRSTDNSVLGVVSDKYQIVQNKEAFAFTDEIVNGKDTVYETCGSLRNGKTIWLMTKMPKTKILDEDYENYLCFTNTHDGTGAVKVFSTPVRVVCNNTLNLALKQAKRSWSARHMGNIMSKLEEASETLMLANKYTEELAKEADKLAHTKLTDERVAEVLQELFPINTEDTDRHKANMKKAQDDLMSCYYMIDIRPFLGTSWGLVQAAADFADHIAPQRASATYNENNFSRVITGHPILDKVTELVSA